MTHPPDPQSGHIAPEELAAITELGAGLPAEWFSAHLAKCRYCMAVYAEFARARAESLTGAMPETADHAVIARAMSIPTMAVGKSADSYPSRRRRVVAAGAVAAGLALATVVTSSWMRSRSTARAPGATTSTDSTRPHPLDGFLYSDEIRLPTGMRGSVEEAGLDSLRLIYNRQPSSDNTFNLIKGLLLAEQGRDADPLLREAVEAFRGESRFRNLAAVLAYKNSDLAKAESELRAALSLAGDSYLLVNLATVLGEQGRLSEADALLTSVVERDPEAPIADLARSRATSSIQPRLEQ